MTPFVIERLLDAPRERVWRAWTEVEHLVHWWGPKGFTVTHCTVDLRPGAMMHYCLRAPDGGKMWGRFVYREIVPPERLVWVNSFSDEKGGITRHPMAPDWPREMLTTVTFAEENGRTRVRVHWIPIDASETERRTFDQGRDSMNQGWSGTFEQLEQYLGLQ
ncbi:MAG: SRPBCC domain-containing protein [Burkholderiales bacterium]|nr:SRPBCC domain-containing protein [Burkholderiales bacterium]